MIDMARSAGAQVMLVTPASNLHDCSPFKSELRMDLSAAERTRWTALAEKASEHEQNNRPAEALAAIHEAEQIDNRHAGLLFTKGRALLAMERAGEAKQAFERARDEDICPLRATTDMIESVRQVAGDKNVPLIDFVDFIDRQSPNGLPGKAWFLDHVHPTIQGHKELALAIVGRMAELDLIHRVDGFDAETIARVADEVESSIDAEMRGRALLNLSKVLGWAGKSQEASRLVQQASETIGNDADVQYGLGIAADRAGNRQMAEQHYRQAISLLPIHTKARFKLGLLLENRGRYEQAVTEYRKTLEIEPQFVEARANLAGVLIKQGNTEAGLEQYRLAVQQKPDLPNAQNNLGILLTKLGDYPQAQHHLEQAIRYHPTFVDAYFNLGVVLAFQGQLDAAQQQFAKVLHLEPGMVRAQQAIQQIETVRQQKPAS